MQYSAIEGVCHSQPWQLACSPAPQLVVTNPATITDIPRSRIQPCLAPGQVIAVATCEERHGLVMALASRWQFWAGGGFDRLAGLEGSITMWTWSRRRREGTVVVVPANEAVPNPLLRQAREARNLTQDEVSEGLVQLGAKGVTGGLVSKWERGICRPNRFHRRLLCQFFDASPEELGFRTGTLLASSGSSEDALVDALIEPAGATIKLSWLVWYGHADAGVVERVTSLIPKLTDFTASHQGELRLPALRLLATAHEMLGKVAFDGLDYPTAFAHFLEMEQLGEAAGDLNLRTLAAIHQGDLLRRRGDYELAVKRLTAAMPAAVEVAGVVEGMRHQTLARAHAENGHKDAFLEAIEAAEAQASSLDSNAADWGNEFTLKQVRHERAHGHTLLWEPKVALGIYLATEPEMHPVSLRDVGNFTILKAQAHAYAGNVDVGVDLAIEGLRFARRYGSARHVSRVQRMYDWLSSTPIGTSAHMRDLADALHAA